jgi:triacylglycerol lipase
MIEKCHHMALLAQAAYMDRREGTLRYNELGYKTVKFFDVEGAQCYVVSNKEEMVICFRGTEPTELSDLGADLNAFPDRGKVGGFVHNGFQNELEKVWNKVKAEVEKKPKKKPLYITGHSLGGAMATICASRLQKQVSCLYTYGSPRVGSKKFIENSNFSHYRHVNNNDAVPRVPFAILGYMHHSPARYINHYGRIRTLTYWQRFKDKLRGRWAAIKKGQLFDGFRDHSMEHYVKYTEKNDVGND